MSSATSYLEAGFQPIPVHSKTGIPGGATGDKGTVTIGKVQGWLRSNKWASANIGLRADGWIGVDVDHYDDKNGMVELFELEQTLGDLPQTVSSTARGEDSPSRQYFFSVPADFRAVDRLSPSIEVVQRHHRYAVVAPSVHEKVGAPYVWYGPNGSELWGFPEASDFAPLPQAWLDHLRVGQAAEHEGFGGTVDEWISTLPVGDPTEKVTEVIDTLPRDGFTHDDVIRILWHVVRLGSEGHTGIKWAIEQIYDAWVKPPYDTSEYVRELELAITGAVEKGGGPEWPEPMDKAALLPIVEKFAGLEDWVWGAKKPSDSERAKLVRYLYTLGLSRHEIHSFVWHSNQNVFAHPSELWNEIKDYEPLPESKDGTETVTLLTEAERKHLTTVPNVIDLYQRIAGLREENPNLPYHRANIWTYLSICYGKIGHLPKRGSFGGVGLNLYTIIAGPTTSGKGEAKNQLLGALRYTLHDTFDDINIGGDPSPEALHKKMIERDGEVTWFNLDEGDQLLARLIEKGTYSTGLQQKLTDWYEGLVGARLRLSDKESAKNAKAYLVIWLMGTPTAIMANLLPKQVESGFLARFVTFFGNPRRITASSLDTDEQDETEIRLGYNPYIKQFALEQAANMRSFKSNGTTFAVKQSPEAKNRLSQARRDVFKPYADHRLADLLEPTLLRLGITMWKAAALVALSRGSRTIELDDALIAVRQMEEWVPNILRLIEGAAASEWTQQVEEVFSWVKSKGSVSKALTYRRFNDRADFELDNLTKSLVNQKRIRDNSKESKWEIVD